MKGQKNGNPLRFLGILSINNPIFFFIVKPLMVLENQQVY